jgi:hypothetical protein
MGLPLFIVCFVSLVAFNILSLFFVLVVLTIICHGEVSFWRGLFAVLGPKWATLSQDLGIFLLLFC